MGSGLADNKTQGLAGGDMFPTTPLIVGATHANRASFI